MRTLFALLLILTLAACAVPEPTLTPAQPEAKPGDAESTDAAATPAPDEPLEPTGELTTGPTTEPTLESTAETRPDWIAFVDMPGNLYLLNRQDPAERQQLTEDGTPYPYNTPDEPSVWYIEPQWSPDGSKLAYIRRAGTPVDYGFQYEDTFWVYDLATGQSVQKWSGQYMVDYSWQPGSTLVAFSVAVAEGYWASPGGASEFATGIFSLDTETGTVETLVSPERGFALVSPRWSPDGRYLSFHEVRAMEGMGTFAYYDFNEMDYIAWDRAIGGYDWSRDGQTIYYDKLTYISQLTERIFTADLNGENETQISPDFENSYSFGPLESPLGVKVAFWTGKLEDPTYSLMVLNRDDMGSIQSLGDFNQVTDLAWTADGSALIFTAGELDARQVIEVTLADASLRVLADGMWPAVPQQTAGAGAAN